MFFCRVAAAFYDTNPGSGMPKKAAGSLRSFCCDLVPDKVSVGLADRRTLTGLVHDR